MVELDLAPFIIISILFNPSCYIDFSAINKNLHSLGVYYRQAPISSGLTVGPVDRAVLAGAPHPGSRDLLSTRQRAPAKSDGSVALLRAVCPVGLAGGREMAHDEHGALPVRLGFVFQASAQRVVVAVAAWSY